MLFLLALFPLTGATITDALKTEMTRGNGPMPSNLLITSERATPPEELKAELLRMTREDDQLWSSWRAELGFRRYTGDAV